MVTVTGLFLLPDGSPDTGTVRLQVATPQIPSREDSRRGDD